MFWWGLFWMAVALMGTLWLKRLRRRRALDVVGDARLWFGARGIDPATLMFNVYHDARLARNAQAVVVVGLGRRHDDGEVGFVVEIEPGLGVVEGELLLPARLALRDRAVAQEARRRHFKLMDGLLTLQRQAQERA